MAAVLSLGLPSLATRTWREDLQASVSCFCDRSLCSAGHHRPRRRDDPGQTVTSSDPLGKNDFNGLLYVSDMNLAMREWQKCKRRAMRQTSQAANTSRRPDGSPSFRMVLLVEPLATQRSGRGDLRRSTCRIDRLCRWPKHACRWLLRRNGDPEKPCHQ